MHNEWPGQVLAHHRSGQAERVVVCADLDVPRSGRARAGENDTRMAEAKGEYFGLNWPGDVEGYHPAGKNGFGVPLAM